MARVAGAGIGAAGIGGNGVGSGVGAAGAREDEAARCGVADSASAWLGAGEGCSVTYPEALVCGLARVAGAGLGDVGIGGPRFGAGVDGSAGDEAAREDEAACCGVADSAFARLGAGQGAKGCSVADAEAYCCGTSQHIP